MLHVKSPMYISALCQDSTQTKKHQSVMQNGAGDQAGNAGPIYLVVHSTKHILQWICETSSLAEPKTNLL